MMMTAEAAARLEHDTVTASCLDHERIAAWYREHHHNAGPRGGLRIREYGRRAFCTKCQARLEVTEC